MLLFYSLTTFVIGFLIYNILRLGENFHLLTSRNYDYVFGFNHLFQNPLDPFIANIKTFIIWLIYLGPVFLFPVIVFGINMGWKKYRKEIILTLIWFILPVITQSIYAKVFTARYILFTLPYLFLLSGVVFLPEVLKKKQVAVFVLLFVIASLIQDALLLTSPEKMYLPRSERSGYLEEWSSGEGILQVSRYLKEAKTNNPGKQIVVGTEGYFGTLPDGLQIYLNDYPIIVKGIGVNIESVDKSLVESKKHGNLTYLVINDSRFRVKNPQEVGLRLIESFPKAKKPDGTRESLLFFELVW